MRSYCDEVDISPLWTLDEHFLVEVKIIIAVVLVESIEVLNVASVSVRIDEGELHTVVFISEGKLKTTL